MGLLVLDRFNMYPHVMQNEELEGSRWLPSLHYSVHHQLCFGSQPSLAPNLLDEVIFEQGKPNHLLYTAYLTTAGDSNEMGTETILALGNGEGGNGSGH